MSLLTELKIIAEKLVYFNLFPKQNKKQISIIKVIIPINIFSLSFFILNRKIYSKLTR